MNPGKQHSATFATVKGKHWWSLHKKDSPNTQVAITGTTNCMSAKNRWASAQQIPRKLLHNLTVASTGSIPTQLLQKDYLYSVRQIMVKRVQHSHAAS